MASFERCGTCEEIVNFALDRIGRVYVVCPVCHEGRKPFLTPESRLALQRRNSELFYCTYDLCGKAYEKTGTSQKYCCQECADADRAVYEAIGGRALATYLLDLPERRCGDGVHGCGLLYKPTVHHQIWCGEACRVDARRRQRARDHTLKRIAKREARQAQQRQQNATAGSGDAAFAG